MRETPIVPGVPEVDGEAASETDVRIHAVRWQPDDWAVLERAAEAFADREHIRTTPTDIIRSGAMRRAEEILAQAAAQ